MAPNFIRLPSAPPWRRTKTRLSCGAFGSVTSRPPLEDTPMGAGASACLRLQNKY